jgi:hypothetical protein
MNTATNILGYVRDFAAAAVGLAILFGANFSDEQIAGILLLVTTGTALGSYLWGQYKKEG